MIFSFFRTKSEIEVELDVIKEKKLADWLFMLSHDSCKTSRNIFFSRLEPTKKPTKTDKNR